MNVSTDKKQTEDFMKKIFGVQAEINLTADEEIVRGLGKGIQNGSVAVMDIINEIKPAVSECLKKALAKDNTDDKAAK